MSYTSLRRWLIGSELPTKASDHQAFGKTIGLAVFAADSLSSVAYAGGEILMVLAILGSAYYWAAVPISIFIGGLLIILAFSYRQTIFAYPNGGGAYVVAHDNLGELPAQAAGASLLIDYILTVAVSIASAVDQMASAFPVLYEHKVLISLFLILLITLVNLRGVKESGLIFAIPSYFFILMMLLMIVVGMFKAFTGTLGTVHDVPGVIHDVQHVVGWMIAFVMLRAFSSGTAALTGVEAIANGITAFKRPRSKNAATTLLWDAALLMILFLFLGILAYLVKAQPSEQEVLVSQVARTIYGGGALRLATLVSATVILVMAANTPYNGFPRLAALMAGDNYLPKHFGFRSSRLVYQWGIVFLAMMSSLLIVIFSASVTRLIPLYAIGVFMCFTLSQHGMAVRAKKIGRLMAEGRLTPDTEIETHGSILKYDRSWWQKWALNEFGAFVTFVVMLIFLITKFTGGAWIIMFAIPSFVYIFRKLHSHYNKVADVLSTEGKKFDRRKRPVETIVLVADVHLETLQLLEFANSLGVPWSALHIAVNEEHVPTIELKWKERVGDNYLLKILSSPYRSLTKPLRVWVEKWLQDNPEGYLQVVVGVLIMESAVEQAFHQNAHFLHRLVLNSYPRVVTSCVPVFVSLLDNGHNGAQERIDEYEFD